MENIQASMVIEILGKPKNHVEEAIESIVIRVGTEKGVKLLNKTIHEPNPIEKSDLFTTFAELEVEFASLENYFGVIFAYMPSHIEIINPEKISLTNADLNTLGNALIQRLHNYDGVTKKLIGENRFLAQKLQEVAPELFKPIEQAKEKQDSEKKAKKTKKKNR